MAINSNIQDFKYSTTTIVHKIASDWSAGRTLKPETIITLGIVKY